MRIVCLSAEAADICARLGAWEDVVAVTAFAVQAPLRTCPVIGGFSTTDVDRIVELCPDLVICFSDVQAEIAAQLIRRGSAVLTTNQRTLAEIDEAIRLIGGAVGRFERIESVVSDFHEALKLLKGTEAPRPKVYFEEWPDPAISAIAWVGELIELAGGEDVFATRRGRASRERTVQWEEVIAANPDIIIASWCGRPVNVEAIASRPGFSEIRAVRDRQVHAIDSSELLQPGPHVLCGGWRMRRIFEAWRRACIPADTRSP